MQVAGAGGAAGADAAKDAGAVGSDASTDAASGGDSGLDAGVGDECPDDADKTAPGECGCGVPERCAGVVSWLAHRYRFDGTSTTALDSAGVAHGSSTMALTGSGSLALSGTRDAYATLPPRLLSTFAGVTVEFWLTWQGGSRQQRAVSFGTATPKKPSETCAGAADFFNGSWYHFCQKDGITTWSKARGLCESAGGYLVSIESAAEDSYLDSHPAFTESVWTGANDLRTEGDWFFANGAGLQGGVQFWSGDQNGSAVAGAYVDWRRDQPNPDDSDPNVDCSFIFKPTNSWMAYGCEFDGAFVCEWRGHQGSAMNRGVWFTPADADDRPSLGFQAGPNDVLAQGTRAFPIAMQTHVALVLDPARNRVLLYIDGALAASAASTDPLASLRDADNWLGRSHITDDPAFAGSLSELRIYGRPLTADELVTSYKAGPDPAFLETP